ncbi:MAG: AmmeMemoRadiSam system radical SAM enzyme [Thermoanaerobaculales bacterium]|nr:AmmeMemoRadiSam system radical SAM enzyme [Thermoanaerobaculales bacterium]
MKIDRRRMVVLGSAGAAVALHSLPSRAAARPSRTSAGDLPAREASWYKKLEDGRVECQLCPQACTVAEMERGMCGVRENRGGTYYTLVHGRACAVHVDPIEKKPFFHVMPGEKAFSFSTAGCNVECKFCQNWELSQFRPEQVEAYDLPPAALVEAAKRSGARLTAATYGEPVVFWEYVRDAAVAANAAGVKPVVVSNGFIQEQALRDVLPLLSAVKVDLKSFREQFYREHVRGKLEPVLNSLQIIHQAGVWLEIVVLLVPTLNDSAAEIRDMTKWIAATLGPDVPIHFTRFHPTYRLTDLPPTPVATLERAWDIGRGAGLHYVYLGNVPGHPGENTVCPGCGGIVIRRMGFQVLQNNLKDGACPGCHRRIPGLWS